MRNIYWENMVVGELARDKFLGGDLSEKKKVQLKMSLN